jgi:ketosteroid isomerase-like protein
MSMNSNSSVASIGLTAWHSMVENKDPSALDNLLADDAVFHSPVVHSPQRGNPIVKAYLSAAFQILDNGNFRYVREVVGETDAMLEFSTVIDGMEINGVDMIHWNQSGEIDDFKVMLRPLKAVNLIHQIMAAALKAGPG